MAAVRFMLDTNTASYILRGLSPRGRKRMANLREGEDVCISAITEAEIRYGLAKRAVKAEFRVEVERFLDAIDVLPWSSDAARVYASLRADLEKAGRTLSNLDMLIASHAVASRCTLVTNDRAFQNAAHVLKIVSWADDLPLRT